MYVYSYASLRLRSSKQACVVAAVLSLSWVAAVGRYALLATYCCFIIIAFRLANLVSDLSSKSYAAIYAYPSGYVGMR